MKKNFSSDNVSGASPEILRAIVESNADDTAPYAPKELLGVLGAAATSAGLSKTPAFTQTIEEGGDSAPARKTVTARLLREPLPAPLAWFQRALSPTPELYVTQFNLKPTRQGWDMEVRFARWELKQQS